ncbi:MAG: FecR domain-containing protein [Williamsia sp.]|nr:FecR domain-containing protein [Williamsia sp.]
MVTKESIERFFRGECSPEEQEQVWAFFKANPEEFAQYLDESEWESFVSAGKVDPALSNQLFENIRRQTIGKTGRIKTVRRMAVAAAVLLTVVLGWMYFSSSKQAVPVARTGNNTKENPIALVTRHERNQTGKDKTISLEDGSWIILSGNSEISYQLPFTNSRNITLTGRAFFKVAKDKTRPFTVTSGEITTTALGTEFTVSAYEGSKSIVVRLYEGRIVIKAANKADKRMKNDVYLSPGQEFVYGAQRTAGVHAFKVNSSAAPAQIMAEEISRDNPSLPQNTKGTWFQFNNRPVDEVLDQLAEIYKVDIVYDKKDVQKLYFIGKYKSADSVETILGRIGILYHLTITKNDTAFIVSK